MATLGAEATFLAAGGYHHHIGANVWESRGAPPPPPGTAALRHATVVLPDEAERDRILARVRGGGHEVGEDRGGPVVTDPSGNRLVLARPIRRLGGRASGTGMKVAVVGHVEACAFATVDHVPVAGEIVEAEEGWEQAAGGGAVAAVQLARLAGECLFLTAVADDRFGRAAKRDLEALGLRVEAAWRPPTQRRAFVHLDATGERTITVTGDRLAPAIADPLPWAELESCDAVYFTAGDRGAAVAARKATRLVATIRAKEGLSGSGVELDVLVASAGDRGERYVSGTIEPLPRAVVLTAGVEGGLIVAADGD